MSASILSLPNVDVNVDAEAALGPLETWRHTLSHGGINTHPLPPRVVEGVRKLQPRLIRIFIQEFFHVYPEHGRYDWSLLDPYMDSFAQTGARVVASICIKPACLFPAVDHRIWQPTNTEEWQAVIAAMVRRYSVERPIVSHWEVGNETDIGEHGGTPFLIPEPDTYAQFYRMTIQPILETFPEAKVGGPAACWVDNEPLLGFVALCRRDGVPLDFISWHLYHGDPARHAAGVEKANELLADFPPDRRPETMVTEWSKGFDKVSVEELAFDPRRAACVAAGLLAMGEAGLDWSFYYHIWDQVCYPESFRPFFSEEGVAGMVRHWNEVPHRFGLFGVEGEVRPQYFVYQMLSRMGDTRVAAACDEPDIRALAAHGEGRVSILLVNYNAQASQDRVLTLRFANVLPGRKRLVTHRIDADRRWSEETLELRPAERREVATGATFQCQVLVPADTVTLVELDG